MFVILIVTAGLVLAAGCAGQSGGRKNVGNVPSTVLITSSLPTSTQIESHEVPQESFWIKIDPISDKQVGDIFTITFTTNVSTGEEILVQVYSSTFFPGPKMQTREFSGATGTIKVILGTNGLTSPLSHS
jgi:hypothetical protein